VGALGGGLLPAAVCREGAPRTAPLRGLSVQGFGAPGVEPGHRPTLCCCTQPCPESSPLASSHPCSNLTCTRTGLANPGPVAAALWTDEEIEAGVQVRDPAWRLVPGVTVQFGCAELRARQPIQRARAASLRAASLPQHQHSSPVPPLCTRTHTRIHTRAHTHTHTRAHTQTRI